MPATKEELAQWAEDDRNATVMPITLEDLSWWLELWPTLEWKRARSYDDTAPHSYVVRDKHLASADFDRAVRLIHSFGELGNFHSRINAYLVDPGRQWKWWTMGMGVALHGVINKAEASAQYGRKIAPATHVFPEGKSFDTDFTPFDAIASYYDDVLATHPARKAIQQAIGRRFGAFAPRALDVGAGTGFMLDTGMLAPALTTVVDPSRGMLNHLVVKHPKTARVLPGSWSQQTLHGTERGSFDLVSCVGGAPAFLTLEELRELREMAKTGGMLLLEAFEPGVETAKQLGFEHGQLVAGLQAARALMNEFRGFELNVGGRSLIIINGGN